MGFVLFLGSALFEMRGGWKRLWLVRRVGTRALPGGGKRLWLVGRVGKGDLNIDVFLTGKRWLIIAIMKKVCLRIFYPHGFHLRN